MFIYSNVFRIKKIKNFSRIINIKVIEILNVMNPNKMKHFFLLDPTITFLNFGSFGACPKPIFDDYLKWQFELEKDPVHFITESGPSYLLASRKALSKYINCDEEGLIFTPNPTHAINIIAKSLKLSPDDEILTTDLEYGAMDRTWNFYSNKIQAKYVKSKITLPILSKAIFLEEFWKGYTERTKIVFISHITSSTALILPVKEICEEAKKRGLITIVDGAHVPGHVSLNLKDIEADFYTGACHKWMMAPKGCSFLYSKKEIQSTLDPLIISWGYESDYPSNSPYFDYHQFNGTRDFSAYLTLPAAINFMNENNWNEVSKACRNMVLTQIGTFLDFFDAEPLAPLNYDFFGQMASIPIKTLEPLKLKQILYESFRIQIPVIQHNGNVYLRFSIQGFNTIEDLNHLLEALNNIRKTSNLI
jgi:isopenicillin-N epimerase